LSKTESTKCYLRKDPPYPRHYTRIKSNDLPEWVKKVFNSEHTHSILVGKHIAYCMDCGQILFEYSDKKIIKQLMNPYTNLEELEE